MKRHYPVIAISLVMLSLSFAAPETYAAEVEIEDVYIDQTFNSSLWAIKGIVRNLENRRIKGYVQIRFLSNKGHVFKSVAAAVNNSEPLEQSESGEFLYPAFKKYFERTADFQITFVEVEIKEPTEIISPVLRR